MNYIADAIEGDNELLFNYFEILKSCGNNITVSLFKEKKSISCLLDNKGFTIENREIISYKFSDKVLIIIFSHDKCIQFEEKDVYFFKINANVGPFIKNKTPVKLINYDKIVDEINYSFFSGCNINNLQKNISIYLDKMEEFCICNNKGVDIKHFNIKDVSIEIINSLFIKHSERNLKLTFSDDTILTLQESIGNKCYYVISENETINDFYNNLLPEQLIEFKKNETFINIINILLYCFNEVIITICKNKFKNQDGLFDYICDDNGNHINKRFIKEIDYIPPFFCKKLNKFSDSFIRIGFSNNSSLNVSNNIKNCYYNIKII